MAYMTIHLTATPVQLFASRAPSLVPEEIRSAIQMYHNGDPEASRVMICTWEVVSAVNASRN